MAHDVFISYSSHDKPVADAACAALEQQQIRCWIAPRDVLPGVAWGAAIVDAIHASRVLVLILSADSNISPQVLREVGRAASGGVPIVPFKVADVELSKEMEYFVSDVHWLDAITPPVHQHLHKLTSSVRALLDVSSQPPPAPRASAAVPASAPEPSPTRGAPSLSRRARSLWPIPVGVLLVTAVIAIGVMRSAPAAGNRDANLASAAGGSAGAVLRPTASSSPAGATSTARTRFGPTSASITQSASSRGLDEFPSRVNLAAFAAEARFSNPYDRTEHPWDYGFVFRKTGNNREYRLWVDSDRSWYLRYVDGDPTQVREIQRGSVGNLDVSPTGANTLRVEVDGKTGSFLVNNTRVGTLDLSAKTESGDVALAINFGGGQQVAGRFTRFADFSVVPYP